MSEAIRVYPLKKITTKFIVEKGYDDARAAKVCELVLRCTKGVPR